MKQDLLNSLIAIVGRHHTALTPEEKMGYLKEPRGQWHGDVPLVLRPATSTEVAQIVTLCAQTRTAMIPQSGNTGLVGGQVPATGKEVMISLDRMTRIIHLDPIDYTITVEAGAVLQKIQEAAAAVDRLFPLSLASEGSCRIGGNLASNAGGLNVLAYGNARDLCLGLEVVLPNGEVWNGLRRLRKDNTGYNLKDIFIGAEGTLGIITAAVLKLYPLPIHNETALIAMPSPKAAVDFLSFAKERSGNRVAAFELMPKIGMDFTTRHMKVNNPLKKDAPWYVLCELADTASEVLPDILEKGIHKGWVLDAVIAQTEAQRHDIWAIRERMPGSQKFEGGSLKHDVSVAVSKIPQFMQEAEKAVLTYMPEARIVSFGHMGDGNMHFNITQPKGMKEEEFMNQWQEINACVYGVVERLNGSISAEHGIGQLKRHYMTRIKSPVELQMMHGIKKSFDPDNIMNPGKLLPDMIT